MSNVQIMHQLLSQLGLKFQFRWSRSMPDCEGVKTRVYRLDFEYWAHLQEVLERRRRKREAFEQAAEVAGSPLVKTNTNKEGNLEVQAYLEALADAMQYGKQAVQAAWDGIPEELKLRTQSYCQNYSGKRLG